MWWAIICWKITHPFLLLATYNQLMSPFSDDKWSISMDIFVASLIWSGIFWGHNSGLKSFIKSAKKIAMESLPSGDWYVYVVKFWGQCGNSKSGIFLAQQSSSELVIQGIKTKIWAPTSCSVHHWSSLSHFTSQKSKWSTSSKLRQCVLSFSCHFNLPSPKSPFFVNGWYISTIPKWLDSYSLGYHLTIYYH